MKPINPIFILAIMAMSLLSCNAQVSEESKSTSLEPDLLQVYYFHNTKRCATCLAVESETKLILEAFYGDKMKNGAIEFVSLNLEEEDGKEFAKSLNVAGQALLLVKGDIQVNLTNEGFLNARSNPEKFHEILKTQIDKLL